MRTAFNNLAFFHHMNYVCPLDRRQPVRYRNDCHIFRQPLDRINNLLLRNIIQGARSLVK